MIEKRIKAAREMWIAMREPAKEYKLFRKYFPGVKYNGVLTPVGEDLTPEAKGLFLVDQSEKIRKKINKEETLTQDEIHRIREAGWNSIDGDYMPGFMDNDFMVGISINDPNVDSFLKANHQVTAAFLECSMNGQKRYPVTQEIDAFPTNIIFKFPKVVEPVTLIALHLYTRPEDRSKVDPRFARLSFILYPSSTESNPRS